MVRILGWEATRQFKKSFKRIKKRGKDIHKLIEVIKKLEQGTLDKKYKDHELKGNFVGKRECHVESDWLLVYFFKGNTLVLIDTGTHADIFGL